MSHPYHRSNNSNNYSSMTHRPSNSKSSNDEATRSLMEQQNDLRWMELGERVDMLKSLSVDINQEVKEQNSLLDAMGTSFSDVSSLFTSTIGKLGNMLGASSSQHMCYLVFFVVFVFLLLYMMMRK
jgi:blocked-early-in-transport protein 1